jgi:hypothetical protein
MHLPVEKNGNQIVTRVKFRGKRRSRLRLKGLFHQQYGFEGKARDDGKLVFGRRIRRSMEMGKSRSELLLFYNL